MAWNKWEWLEGIKPESLVDASVRHMAGLIADALIDWPPEVEADAGDHVAAGDPVPAASTDVGPGPKAWRPGAARPGRPVFVEAFKRVRWELERNYDAIDFYERNHHLARACPDPNDQRAARFVEHYVLESFYFLMERTDYRVKRKDVQRGIDRVEERVLARIAADETRAN